MRDLIKDAALIDRGSKEKEREEIKAKRPAGFKHTTWFTPTPTPFFLGPWFTAAPFVTLTTFRSYVAVSSRCLGLLGLLGSYDCFLSKVLLLTFPCLFRRLSGTYPDICYSSDFFCIICVSYAPLITRRTVRRRLEALYVAVKEEPKSG